MGRSYAAGRRRKVHLRWRYEVRAAFAARAFRDRMSPPSEPRVLDLGCAEGKTLAELRSLLGPQGRFYGVELSDELLAEAPALPDNVKLIKGDVARLPTELAEGTFDLVVALAVLEHLPDPARCLAEAWRMLRPGGVVVVSAPHPVWDEIAGKLKLVADEHHEQHLDGSAIRDLMHQVGFGDVSTERFMWAPLGALPYAGVWVRPATALRIDRLVDRARVLGPSFVNQGVVAVRQR